MIHFKTIRFKNILSTGNAFTEIKLDKKPKTLIIGINGAGKSTMLDALTFALYGKPFREINKPDLVNTINDGHLVTEIEFAIASNEYKIVRGIKPTIFEIWCNGSLKDQDGSGADYQDYLEYNILKLNFEAFKQIVVLGASTFTPFMQLTASARRVIIEDLLDIKIFSSMNLIVKNKAMDIKNNVNSLKTSIDNTMSKIQLQAKHVAEARKTNQELVEAKAEELDTYDKEDVRLEESTSKLIEDIDKLKSSIEDIETVKKKFKDLTMFEIKIEMNKKKAVDQRDFYIEHDNCPSCHQTIEAEFKKGSLEGFETKIAGFDKGLDSIKAEKEKVSNRLAEIDNIQQEVLKIGYELTQQTTSWKHVKEYAKKLVDEIEELKGKKVLSEDMTKISHELAETLTTLKKDRDAIIDERQYYEVAATLLKDNGIKAKIVKQYLPIINKLVNKYLNDMDFFVNFEIDEEFKETIKSRYRDTFSYENFSEGEKMRIDLALLFTWRSIAKLKNSMSTNLLILDEVFDSSLDATGTDEFMKLLESLSNDNNIFVISHKGDILVDKFDNVIKFTKTNGFSHLVKD